MNPLERSTPPTSLAQPQGLAVAPRTTPIRLPVQGAVPQQTNSVDLTIPAAPMFHVSPRTETQRIYYCAGCEYFTTVIENYQKHLGLHQRKYFECPYCDMFALKKESLREHIDLHFATHVLPVERRCESKDDEEFFIEEISVQEVKEDLPYKCDLCDYQSKWKHNLITHTRNRHRKSSERPSKRGRKK
jgi:hypothetical protein